jgi:amino acid permease
MVALILNLSVMEKFRKNKRLLGIILIAAYLLMLLIRHSFFFNSQNNVYSFVSTLILISGILLIIPFEYIPYFFYDNREYKANKTIEQLINKLRYRATLFNNISIAVLLLNIVVIKVGFYLLINPPLKNATDQNQLATSLTIRIGASVLLIFLVHILFRVFKYTLRVAAFYHAKADAIEFNKLKPETDLEKYMDLFTPDKYDISDLQQSSISDNLIEIIKSKSIK